MKLPDDIPVNTPRAARGVSSVPSVNYGGASAAINAYGRAQQRGAENMMDQALEREKQAEKDAVLMASQREIQAKRETLDLLYGKDGQPGLYSRKGRDALGLEGDYQKKFLEIRNRALEGITNPVAQEHLTKAMDSLDLSNLNNVKSQEQTQRLSYTTELAASSAALAQQRVTLEWNNEQTFQKSLAETEASAANVGKLKGLSADGITEGILKERSTLYRTRLTAMLSQDDPTVVMQANKIYKDAVARGDIHFSDVIDMDKAFNTVMPKAKAYDEFRKFQGGNTLATMQADEIFPALINVESGGQHYAKDGGVLTSSAGAKGIAQLMPDTAKEMAKEMGIDPSTWMMPEVNAVLGKAYLQKMQNKFGDNTLAVLSYNWGPGNVEDHIKEVGDPRKGEVSYDYFLATVPSDEARQYVPKVMASAGLTSGRLDLVRADRLATGMDADVGKEFLTLVNQQNGFIDAQEKEQQKSAMDEVFAFLQSAKGNSWANMPNTIRTKAVNAGLDEQIQIYSGQTAPEMANFLYSLEPKALKDFDLDTPSVRFALSPEDYNRWKEKQVKLDNPAMLATEEARNKMVNRAFEKRGINMVNPKKADRIKKNEFNELLDASMAAFSAANNGRSPNGAEIQGLVDQLFMEKITDRDMLFDDTAEAYTQKYEDIPKKERAALEQALRDKGFAVTEPMVVIAYLKGLPDAPVRK